MGTLHRALPNAGDKRKRSDLLRALSPLYVNCHWRAVAKPKLGLLPASRNFKHATPCSRPPGTTGDRRTCTCWYHTRLGGAGHSGVAGAGRHEGTLGALGHSYIDGEGFLPTNFWQAILPVTPSARWIDTPHWAAGPESDTRLSGPPAAEADRPTVLGPPSGCCTDAGEGHGSGSRPRPLIPSSAQPRARQRTARRAEHWRQISVCCRRLLACAFGVLSATAALYPRGSLPATRRCLVGMALGLARGFGTPTTSHRRSTSGVPKLPAGPGRVG